MTPLQWFNGFLILMVVIAIAFVFALRIAPAGYGQYSPAWLATPQFVIGLVIFLAGFVINIHSDHIVRNLRKPGDTAFHIPRGGMFRYVTSANYFGEFTEWVGWAIMTWSWVGLVFAIWVFANLGPRADTHHHWYIKKFGDEYPRDRKRMIPFIY
jgi:3-oxo-5-alpha-steroid 4-dehydrogenase 1